MSDSRPITRDVQRVVDDVEGWGDTAAGLNGILVVCFLAGALCAVVCFALPAVIPAFPALPFQVLGLLGCALGWGFGIVLMSRSRFGRDRDVLRRQGIGRVACAECGRVGGYGEPCGGCDSTLPLPEELGVDPVYGSPALAHGEPFTDPEVAAVLAAAARRRAARLAVTVFGIVPAGCGLWLAFWYWFTTNRLWLPLEVVELGWWLGCVFVATGAMVWLIVQSFLVRAREARIDHLTRCAVCGHAKLVGRSCQPCASKAPPESPRPLADSSDAVAR